MNGADSRISFAISEYPPKMPPRRISWIIGMSRHEAWHMTVVSHVFYQVRWWIDQQFTRLGIMPLNNMSVSEKFQHEHSSLHLKHLPNLVTFFHLTLDDKFPVKLLLTPIILPGKFKYIKKHLVIFVCTII